MSLPFAPRTFTRRYTCSSGPTRTSATCAADDRAISGYPVLTMRSNAARSNMPWIAIDAKVYAVS